MKPELQRIKIAEACGWKQVEPKKFGNHVVEIAFEKDGAYYGGMSIPDYLNDLNAMHEAEMSLTHEKLDDFQDFLWEATECQDKPINLEGRKTLRDWRNYTHATAAQRAEAFLKTLGFWEETP